MAKEKTTGKSPNQAQDEQQISEIRQAFVACPRCSFFLTGYDLLHGDLKEAMLNVNGKWLDLHWNLATRNLVHKSYGVNIRADDSHYEGVCSDCRRIFVFDIPAEGQTEPTFKIKINPSR